LGKDNEVVCKLCQMKYDDQMSAAEDRFIAKAVTLLEGFYLIEVAVGQKPTSDDEHPTVWLVTPPRNANLPHVRGISANSESRQCLSLRNNTAIVEVGSAGGTLLIRSQESSTQTAVVADINVVPLDRVELQPSVYKAPRRARIPVELVARIERLGRRRFLGGWAGSRSGHLSINEIAVHAVRWNAPIEVEIKAFAAKQAETPWTPLGRPCCVDGDVDGLLGFAARTSPSYEDHFAIVYQARFAKFGTTRQYRDGEECRSPIPDDKLVGICLWVEDQVGF
jgi:hypothetical protein